MYNCYSQEASNSQTVLQDNSKLTISTPKILQIHKCKSEAAPNTQLLLPTVSKLTINIEEADLTDDCFGVDLTHVVASVSRLYASDAEEPRAVAVVCYADAGVTRDHVIGDCQDYRILFLDPCYLLVLFAGEFRVLFVEKEYLVVVLW